MSRNRPTRAALRLSPMTAFRLDYKDSNSDVFNSVQYLNKGQITRTLVESASDFRIYKVEDRRYNSDKKMDEYHVRQILFNKLTVAELSAQQQNNWVSTNLTGKN